MAKGIIYIMTTVVDGLIKIGKTGSNNFEQRMRELERTGYRNVTGLKRAFAIEVSGYEEKEVLLHTIFEKSRVYDTELFALDLNLVKKLLASFDGKMIYPKDETKAEVFDEAVLASVIPDGEYKYRARKKKSDGDKMISATVIVEKGHWILQKGAILGVHEDKGVTDNVRRLRSELKLSKTGELLEDYDLKACAPSCAAAVVMNQSQRGWMDWIDADEQYIDKYRQKDTEE